MNVLEHTQPSETPEGREHDDRPRAWVTAVKMRGLTQALRVTLDALEPLGPLGAQLLYVMQPVLGLFGAQAAVDDIAQALEEPGGIDTVRGWLEDEVQVN